MKRTQTVALLAMAGALAASPSACALFKGAAVPERFGWLALVAFALIIAITMYLTYRAAKRVNTTQQFYAAGRSISGLQNGWAIAGDYLSAASFLGIAGLISLYGYDGFMYSVGFLVAYITVLLLIAEPCRNIGKYTLGDILAFRNDHKTARLMAAISTITVSIVYLTAQMVGGGLLVKTLIGIDYAVSVVVVGVLMLVYVVFGGMVATTWVQIIKAVLLVVASLLLVICTWAPYDFSLPAFFGGVVADAKVQAQVAKLLGDAAANMSAADLGQRFLEPGLYLKNPVDQISLGMALVLGTAGLPHILMRFFTVPNAQQARLSVIWAMIIIGGFYLLTLIIGNGAALHVGATAISGLDKGGNMAAPLLAQYIGGGAESALGNFFLAFIAAVAFATIVAVVAGLVLASASAISHDIWVGIVKGERATQAEEVRAARVSALIVGTIAMIIGILAQGQNVAHLVGLAFAVAASSNLPCILLTLYWKRCNTGGIVLGMILGTLTAVALVLVSPNMTYPLTEIANAQKVIAASAAKHASLQSAVDAAVDAAAKGRARAALEKADADVVTAQKTTDRFAGQSTSLVGLEKPLTQLKNPGLYSIPIGFLGVILGSLFWRRGRKAADMWEELYVRQNTGIHAEQL
jgi:cation/acetate symporter